MDVPSSVAGVVKENQGRDFGDRVSCRCGRCCRRTDCSASRCPAVAATKPEMAPVAARRLPLLQHRLCRRRLPPRGSGYAAARRHRVDASPSVRRCANSALTLPRSAPAVRRKRILKEDVTAFVKGVMTGTGDSTRRCFARWRSGSACRSG